MKKKTVALLLALTLVLGVVAGGTIAWLTSTSDTVTNTFTTSDINVKLEETKGTPGTTATEKRFQMTPGWTIEKNPQAWVETGSVDCYLFVKLDKSTNFDTFMTFAMAEGWELVDGTTNVYSRVVKTANMGTKYSILAGDKVTVKEGVTKEQMNGLTKDTYPTLTVTAYASQYYRNNTPAQAGEIDADTTGHFFTAKEAWANISTSGTTTP